MHDALDPEYSILKQRIARRLRHEGATDESVKGLNLSEWKQQAGQPCSACMGCHFCGSKLFARHMPMNPLMHPSYPALSWPSPPVADITKVAERTISDDLEFLISQAVDPKKADYAGEVWV